MRRLALALVALVLVLSCTSPSPDGAAPGPLGPACRQSSECASGRCVPRIGETIGGDVLGVCTHVCAGDGDCLRGWSCLATSSGTDLCQCQRSTEICDGADNDCNGIVDDAAGGVCSCPTGRKACSNTCADLASDPSHCGSCENACPPGASCKASTCACPGSSTACEGACVDLKNDARNCGRCGEICGWGTTCAEGVCRCGPGGKGDACKVVPASCPFCGDDIRCHTRTFLPRAPGYGGVTALAVGSEAVIYGTSSGYASYRQTLHVFKKPGGPVTQLDLGGLARMPSVAADGPDLVYTVGADLSIPGKTVGCPGGVCGVELAPAHKPVLAAYAGHAYWLGATGVERCAISGCAGIPEAVGDAPAGANALRVDASGAYLLYPSMLGRIPTGGVFEVLAPLTAPRDFQVGADRVFVRTDNGFVQCAKTGCGGAVSVFLTAGGVRAFVADAAHLYWLTSTKLWGCPSTGATCAAPASIMDMGSDTFLAYDGDSFYTDGPSVISK